MSFHEPVLTAEVVSLLVPGGGGCFVDCTVGLGGHALALLEAGATRLVGIDRDAEALEQAAVAVAPWRDRVTLVHADFRELPAVLDREGTGAVRGILADLGVSSFQLAAEGRGFSFQRDEPLDMRMDRGGGPTAAELIAGAGEQELADVIFRYGEERYSRRVARAIVAASRAGALTGTRSLAEVARRAIPRHGRPRIDPATRTFQALRIWTNDELGGLDLFLRAACGRLEPGGRAAVISFHSLEDRIVKHTFRSLAAEADAGVTVLTKKPLVPAEAERQRNPRSRSAKLRAVERRAAGDGPERG